MARRTRYMSWLFLALSAGFFFVQDFRWALRLPVTHFQLMRDVTSLWQSVGETKLRRLAERAEQAGDVPGLAFAALEWQGDPNEALRFADFAVARDPRLGWLYYHLGMRWGTQRPSPDPALLRRVVEKAVAADPNNAVVYLLRAEMVRRAEPNWPLFVRAGDRYPTELLAGRREWLEAMEGAVTRPVYNTHVLDRFWLEREVLLREGWATPENVLLPLISYPIPNLLNLRDYANYRLQVAEESKGNRDQRVIADGFLLYHFGQRMEVSSRSLLEQIMGRLIQVIAAEPLQQALRRAGRNNEAESIALAKQRLDAASAELRNPLAISTTSSWAGLMITLLAGLIVVFGALSLACVLYVNAKRWVRPHVRGRLFDTLTVAENYLPIVLFVCCLSLLIVYAPYAVNFRNYMAVGAANADVQSFEPFFLNVYPLAPGFGDPVTPNPFAGYAYWALLCVGVTLALWAAAKVRSRRRRAAEEQARAAGTGA